MDLECVFGGVAIAVRGDGGEAMVRWRDKVRLVRHLPSVD